MWQEDQSIAVDFLQQQGTTREHLRQRLLDCPFGHLQQLHCRELEFSERQSAVTIRSRFQQHVVDARPCPIERVPRNPNLLRDLVSGREADPVDVLRQHVRIALHLLDCLLAVGLEDSHRPTGAHAVAVQEQHDFADLLCLLPRMRYPFPALGTDAIDRLKFCGSGLWYGHDPPSRPPGLVRLTKPLPRYRSIPSAVVGGTVFMVVALNCRPCSLSLTPQPSALSHSPAVPEGTEPMTVVSSRCPRAFTRRTQKPLSSLWKVTRSISPEISSVAGLRSGIAALMLGDSFSHGRSALGYPINRAILRRFRCRGGGSFQRLSHERAHALRVVLEIHKPVTVVQFHLKLPQHCEPQKAGNLRPSVAAYGGEV